MLTGQEWWLPFMLFGYVVVVPTVALLFGDKADIQEWWDAERANEIEEPTTSKDQPNDEALATLRNRYARGELTNEQFERKSDQLLETESLEDIEERERETMLEE